MRGIAHDAWRSSVDNRAARELPRRQGVLAAAGYAHAVPTALRASSRCGLAASLHRHDGREDADVEDGNQRGACDLDCRQHDVSLRHESTVELLQKYRTAPVGSQGPWDASPPTVRHANTEKVVFRLDYERSGPGSGQRERCRSAARRQRGSWRQRTTRTWPVFTA